MLNYFLDAAENNFDAQLLQDIKEKNDEKVKFILQNVTNLPNDLDASGASLLHHAAQFGNESMTAYLIKLESKVNVQNNEGSTPLLLAAKGQHAATIKVLLESDADMYICDNQGVNALQVVLQANPMNVEIVKLFLHQLETDCSSGRAEIAEKLMKFNCPLYVAVLLKNDVVTRCMLSDCCPIDAKDPVTGKTALHVAVENLDLENVNLLIYIGADVNAKDASNRIPLAIMENFNDDSGDQDDIIEQLVYNARAELTSCDDDGFMQMHWILKNGSEKAVRAVLECEFDIYAKDQRERNILHYLAENVNEGVVEVIEDTIDLDENVVNARDEDGSTPLHYAMSIANIRFVKFVCEYTTIVNIVNNKGIIPFLEAVESADKSTLDKRVSCVRSILKARAIPDIMLGYYFKKYNTKLAINRDFDLLKPVVSVLAVMNDNIEYEMRQGIIDLVNSHPKLKEHYDFCTNEAEKMKSEILIDDVTLLDWVCCNVSDSDIHTFCASKVAHKLEKLAKKYQTIPICQELIEEQFCDLNSKHYDWTYIMYTFIFTLLFIPCTILSVYYNYPFITLAWTMTAVILFFVKILFGFSLVNWLEDFLEYIKSIFQSPS